MCFCNLMKKPEPQENKAGKVLKTVVIVLGILAAASAAVVYFMKKFGIQIVVSCSGDCAGDDYEDEDEVEDDADVDEFEKLDDEEDVVPVCEHCCGCSEDAESEEAPAEEEKSDEEQQ